MHAALLDPPIAPAPAFDAPGLFDLLAALPDDAIDALPFGAVGIGTALDVVFYSAREASLSGLSPARVLGRHMFEEVAPCMNNDLVGGRFEAAGELDAVIPFVLTLRMRPTPATLRLLKRPGAPRSWVLIQRTGR